MFVSNMVSEQRHGNKNNETAQTQSGKHFVFEHFCNCFACDSEQISPGIVFFFLQAEIANSNGIKTSGNVGPIGLKLK